MYVNLNRGADGFIGSGPSKEGREKAMDLSKPLTPKSERARATYGSLSMSLQSVQGLCFERKCIKSKDHDGACWPS